MEPSDEDLIGYVFDLLDPHERAALAERAAADPDLAARLDRLRADVAPLLATATAEREDPPAPRPGLAVRAIARVAEHAVAHEPRESEPVMTEAALAALLREVDAPAPTEIEFGSGTRAKVPRPPAPPPVDGPEFRSSGRLRADLIVAACIAFVGVGLVLSGIAKARHQSRVLACQNGLRTLHTGLTNYADTDPQGRYPEVGTAALPTADTFATSLVDRGYLPAGFVPGCPGSPECPAYTYTLGFRAGNQVMGLRRPGPATDPAEENDLMPISADLPAASVAPAVASAGGAVSPHARCMNVLFVGGNVRLTTSANVGPRGDDIYRNLFGVVAAGADRSDAVLGGSGTRP